MAQMIAHAKWKVMFQLLMGSIWMIYDLRMFGGGYRKFDIDCSQGPPSWITQIKCTYGVHFGTHIVWTFPKLWLYPLKWSISFSFSFMYDFLKHPFGSILGIFRVYGNPFLVGGLEHFLFFHILGIGNNHANWLSYFSEGLKPPTSWGSGFLPLGLPAYSCPRDQGAAKVTAEPLSVVVRCGGQVVSGGRRAKQGEQRMRGKR